MIALLLLTLAHAEPAVSGPADGEVVCLTPPEVEARIIRPLIDLRACRDLRAVDRRERSGLAAAYSDAVIARVAAEQERDRHFADLRRSRRRAPMWAGAGFAVGVAAAVALAVSL